MKKDIKEKHRKTGLKEVKLQTKETKKQIKEDLVQWGKYLEKRITAELLEVRQHTLTYKVTFTEGTDIPPFPILLAIINSGSTNGLITQMYDKDCTCYYEVQIWKD